jgi:hypothetical protein
MKTIAFASILALSLISLVTPWSASARVSGPSASGVYRVVPEDGLTKQVEFEARWDERGATTGQMTFRDQAGVVEREDDPIGDPPEDKPSEFYLTADLDSLTIENNRAVMGGTVRDSSNRSYIGRWVQLVVEDNDGLEVPDKLTWCFCQPEPGGWVPVDAEDPRDEGAWFKWWATDAEREDDKGVQSTNIIPGNRHGCPTFLLSAYDFPEERGEGQIQIQQ